MISYWIESVPNLLLKNNSLDKDLNCDVCIIGGGITGITCAYYLSKHGFNVIILEKDLLAKKASGNTTAKITSQHGLFYEYLNNSFSKKFAKDYLTANEIAMNNIENIIKSENIECDFERQSSYIYTNSESDIDKIKNETAILNSLGFPAEYTTSIPLPVSDIAGAIKFPNQAQFHPRKYLAGICNSILNNKVKIFENTKVYDVKKEKDYYLTFTKNNKIKSKYVILASHYPIINVPGFYFLKMYQETSYLIGLETKQELFEGMYLSSNSPSVSFRTAKFGNKKLLIVGGSSHKVGAKTDLSNSYKFLEEQAKVLYPDAKLIYKWNTQDCISLDKIPYIGRFSNLLPNMYVTTGFKKWGMTSSNVAANIITDKILGKENPYEYVFSSTRFHPIKNNKELGNMVKEVTYSLAINKLKIPKDTLNNIAKDDGKIIEVDGKKVGVYRDCNDKIHTIEPICSHLGCELSWNNLDKTWDCPCHGSRFDYNGHSLYDPSIKDLKK